MYTRAGSLESELIVIMKKCHCDIDFCCLRFLLRHTGRDSSVFEEDDELEELR